MKVFVEGMDWMGKWTEITVDALTSLGHQVDYSFHNRKTTGARVSDRLNTACTALGIKTKRFLAWEDTARKQLINRMSGSRWDVLLSIQGKLNPATVQAIRAAQPGIKIVCWWGDVLNDRSRGMIDQLRGVVDLQLISWKGDADSIATDDPAIAYFPFAVSRQHYTDVRLSTADRRKYAAPVSFVGTYYPERCDLIRHLNAGLEKPVKVWGRSWHNCSGIKSNGPLGMRETLKVHAASTISINLNSILGNNGLNMKFYEIWAAGGFQICDRQAVIADSSFGPHAVTFDNPDDLLEKINFYLQEEKEREAIRKKMSACLLERETYEHRFRTMFHLLGMPPVY